MVGRPFLDVRVWSGGLTGGREAHPDVRKWLRGLPGCPEVVGSPSWMSGRPCRMSGSGREALPYVLEGS